MTTTSRVSASVGYGEVRPWQQKWRDIQARLTTIERTYVADDANNEEVRLQVEDFFKDCRELADWLLVDADLPEAMLYVVTDPALAVCDGLAQTIKHHTRNGRARDPLSARISWVHGGEGVRVQIDWSRPSGESGTEDALHLAGKCEAAWLRFFRRHGLKENA